MTVIAYGYNQDFDYEAANRPTAALPDWVKHNRALNAKCERLIAAGWTVTADYWQIRCTHPDIAKWRNLPLDRAMQLQYPPTPVTSQGAAA